MKELKLQFHIKEWFLKPEYYKYNRTIKWSFLFFTFAILKNKTR